MGVVIACIALAAQSTGSLSCGVRGHSRRPCWRRIGKLAMRPECCSFHAGAIACGMAAMSPISIHVLRILGPSITHTHMLDSSCTGANLQYDLGRWRVVATPCVSCRRAWLRRNLTYLNGILPVVTGVAIIRTCWRHAEHPKNMCCGSPSGRMALACMCVRALHVVPDASWRLKLSGFITFVRSSVPLRLLVAFGT